MSSNSKRDETNIYQIKTWKAVLLPVISNLLRDFFPV